MSSSADLPPETAAATIQMPLDNVPCSYEHYRMAKRKFVPIVAEKPQSHAPIHGRGASWSPANRFEKLHVDLTDVDVVDPQPDSEERPRRETQFFRDHAKTIIARNQSPEVGVET